MLKIDNHVQYTDVGSLRVPELKDVCVERCGTALLECILDCKEDGACLSNCIRVEIECIDGESDILIIKSNIT